MARKQNVPPKRPMKMTTMRMRDHHGWKAPAGYKIVVLDRGAVSFNMPQAWLVHKTDPFEMHDGLPPNDNARVMCSYWKFPPGIDWTGLPLLELLAKSTEDRQSELLERGEILKHSRKDLELVWLYQKFMDPEEHRPAFSRILMARGEDVMAVHCLITMDYWPEEERKLNPLWEEIMRSLLVGRYIEDPTKGPLTH